MKHQFGGSKRNYDVGEIYDNEFTKRKLQMVQERIKELQNKENQDEVLSEENDNEKDESEVSMFSENEQD